MYFKVIDAKVMQICKAHDKGNFLLDCDLFRQNTTQNAPSSSEHAKSTVSSNAELRINKIVCVLQLVCTQE